MSTRVLVIPEDFRKDQYVLKPLVVAMLGDLGRPNVQVRVCTDPLLRGVDQALSREYLAEIFGRYGGMVDLFVLCVDRDCEPHRCDVLRDRERWARDQYDAALIGENAWQEIEVWVLAGHDLPSEWVWAEVRRERDPKEMYFLPFAQRRGFLETPGEGRKVLAEEAARRFSRVKHLCPEDVAVLVSAVGRWLDAMA